MELLIDIGAVKDPSDVYNGDINISRNTTTTTVVISPILHWIAVAIMSCFFIEVVLRAILWRSAFTKSLVAVLDCGAVVIALTVSITVTSVAGVASPLDSISMIIIFRCVRIHSMLNAAKQKSRDQCLQKMNSLQIQVQIEQDNNRAKQKIIDEKDFEIKQLRAYLDKDTTSEQLELQNVSSHCDVINKEYSSDLEKAIALSKETF